MKIYKLVKMRRRIVRVAIDKDEPWNGENLYLWNGKDTLFCISEGTGDNLLAEDIEAGYADYWMTDWFELDDDGADLETDGGQWMETKPIREKYHTIGEVIDRMTECELPNDEWQLLDEEAGEELYCRFDKLCTATAAMHTADWEVREYIKRLN